MATPYYIPETDVPLPPKGADVITTLCDCLLEGGAPGIHFYTLNKSKPTLDICQRLELA